MLTHSTWLSFHSSWHCAAQITFGHNMTSITSHLSHSLKSSLRPGDNVVLSRLEHDANAGLWTRMAGKV